MAGRVPAHLTIARDGQSWWIEPSTCPAMDQHRADAVAEDALLAPICQDDNPLRGRRTCAYWYATTYETNTADRVDGSRLWEVATERGSYQQRCAVLCLCARRNRPPGL